MGSVRSARRIQPGGIQAVGRPGHADSPARPAAPLAGGPPARGRGGRGPDGSGPRRAHFLRGGAPRPAPGRPGRPRGRKVAGPAGPPAGGLNHPPTRRDAAARRYSPLSARAVAVARGRGRRSPPRPPPEPLRPLAPLVLPLAGRAGGSRGGSGVPFRRTGPPAPDAAVHDRGGLSSVRP